MHVFYQHAPDPDGAYTRVREYIEEMVMAIHGADGRGVHTLVHTVCLLIALEFPPVIFDQRLAPLVPQVLLQALAALYRVIAHNGQWGPTDLPVFAACMAFAAWEIIPDICHDYEMWAQMAHLDMYV